VPPAERPEAGAAEQGDAGSADVESAERADDSETGDVRADGAQGPEQQAEAVVRSAISVSGAEGSGADGSGTEGVEAEAGGAEGGRKSRRGTRRFPLFTRDTARPEGGGRAAAGDAPAPARQWPILVVLGLVALGLLLTALDVFRYGTLLIGIALVAGGVLRWVMPDVGMLAVRSRFTDIATYGLLGLAIVLLALMVQPDPWLQIPFLKDTLHFTVSSS